MSSPQNIALLIEVSSAHARRMICGISRYAQEHGPWKLHLLECLRPADIGRYLATWRCDGLIARVKTRAIADVLVQQTIPIVNVSGTKNLGHWQRVDTDDAAVCSLTASHLIERGYRSFGFCGMSQYEWSQRRESFFAAELERKGLGCHVLELCSFTVGSLLPRKERRRLIQWISGLPKPAGIMACSDFCGRAVLEACDEAGVAVPDEVGVIGVDNDELICEISSPPLSSIEANCEQIGYVAAETLAQLLCEPDKAPWETLIKPVKVVSRRSTDATAVGEPVVAEAIRFIRAYAITDIGASEVARHVRVSRRFLEQQFRKSIGRTIHTEILRVRLETAQRLLGETDWKLETVAERSGFRQAPHMSAVFYAKLGLRPGQYRQRIQKSLS